MVVGVEYIADACAGSTSANVDRGISPERRRDRTARARDVMATERARYVASARSIAGPS